MKASTERVGVSGPVASVSRRRERRRFAWMSRHRCALVAGLVAVLIGMVGPTAQAQTTYTKANNATALNDVGSWASGTVPTSADVALWDGTVTGVNSAVLGGSLSWGGIRVTNPGGAITIASTAGATLTLGSSGIDMSAATQNLTVNTNLSIGANQNWIVAGGRTLTGIAGNAVVGTGTGDIIMSRSAVSGFDTGVGTIVFNSNGNGTGWGGYSGNITVNSNVKVQSQGNAAAAFGSGTVTLAGGQVFQNAGNWTWGNTIDVTAASVLGNDSGAAAAGRSLKLVGNLTSQNGSGLTFTNNNGSAQWGTSLNENAGFILAGSSTSTYGSTTISANTRVRVGGNATATLAGDGFDAGNRGSLGAGAVTLSAASSQLAFTRTDTHTVANSISGAGVVYIGGTTTALAASSSQIVTFTGTNTYSGGTLVRAGAIVFSATAARPGTGTVTVAAGGTVGLGVGSTSDFFGSADVNGLFAGTLSGFTLNATSGVGIDTSAGDFTYSSNIGSVTRGLLKSGGNTLTLSGSNAYTGNTTVVGGTLAASADNNLGAVPGAATAGSLTIREGAAFRVTTGFTLSTNRSISVGPTTGTGTGTIVVDAGQTLVVGGTIANNGGTGALVKAGVGILTLSASNAFSGGSTLASGTLRVGNDNALGTGTLALNGGAFSSDSATARTLPNNVTVGGNVRLGDGTNAGLLVFSGALDLQGATRTFDSRLTAGLGARLSGVVSNGGVELNGASTGILTLSNNSNSFTGPTTVTSGYLAVTTGAVANSSSLTLAGASTRLYVGENGVTAINNLSGTSAAVIRADFTILGSAGARTMSVNQTVDGTYAGTFVEGSSGRVISLVKTGAATLTLAGAGTYTGTTTVNSGTLRIAGSGALGSASYAGNITNNATLHFDSTATQTLSGSVSGAGTFLKTNSGTVILANNNDYSGTVTVDAGTLQIGNNTTAGFIGNSATVTNNASLVWFRSTDSNVGNAISGTGSITKLGNAILSLNGNNTYSGLTTITSGTLRVGNNSTSGSLGSGEVVNNAALLFSRSNDITAANVISGSGTLTKDGAGRLTLTGSSTYTGATTITSGTLEVGGAGRLGGGSYAAAIDNAGALEFSTSANQTLSGTISGAGSLAKSGAGTLTLTAPNTYAGATMITGGTLAVSSDSNLGTAPGSATVGQVTINGGALSASGGFTLNSNRGIALGPAVGTGDGTIHVTAGTLAYGGIAANSGAGTGSLVKAGAGSLQLTGVNTYSGATTISSGTLEIAGSGQLGGGSYAGAITNDGALTFSSSANQTLSGGITGIGSLAKSGAGVLAIQGTNDYSGATTVSAGTVVVNGAITTSAMTISGGALLAGSGSLADVALSGAVVSPGNSPGNLTVNNMTWDATSSYVWQMYDYQGGEGVGWDLITGTGALTVTGTGFTFNLLSLSTINPDVVGPAFNWSQTTSGTFRMASFAGGVTAPSGQWWTLNSGSFSPFSTLTGSFSVTTTANDVLLVYTYTPPPAYVWTAGDGTWSTGANWDINTPPQGTVDLIFSGTGGTATNDLVSGTGAGELATVTSLVFSGSAGPYVIAGNGFTLGSGGVVNQASSTQAIQANLTLDGVSLVNAQAADVVVSGSVFTAGSTLSVTGSSNTTLSGVVTGSGGLAKQGAGTLTLTNANDYTGGTTITSGTVKVGDGATSGVLPGNVANNAALVFDRSDAVTYAGTISGIGTLTQAGGGLLTLTGTSTFAGDTAIASGTLVLGGAGQLGSGAYGGGIANGGVLSVATSEAQTFSGTISGSGPLLKSGAGGLTLTAANTFAGGLTLASGTVLVGNDAALGSGTATLDGGAISSDGVTARSVANALVFSGDITLGDAINSGGLTFTGPASLGGATRTLTAASTVTLAGDLSNGGLTKAGSGTLALTSAASTYTDATTLGGGFLEVSKVDVGGNPSSIGQSTSAAANLVFNGGGLTYIGGGDTTDRAFTIASAPTINASGSGALVWTGASPTFTTPNAAVLISLGGTSTAANTLGTVLSDNGSGAVSLQKQGAGRWVLSGINTFTGTVAITAGTLEIGGAGQLGGGVYAGAIDTVGVLSYASSANQTLSGTISGVGSLTASGPGTLTLTRANAHSGGTTISGGRVRMGDAGALGTGTATLVGGALSSDGATPRNLTNALAITGDATLGNAVDNGLLTVSGSTNLGGGTRTLTLPSDVTLSGVVTNGGLAKVGAGTLRLSGVNTYTLGTTLVTGTIVAVNSSALGSSGTVTINAAATGASDTSLLIDAGAATVTIARAITIANEGSGVTTLGSGSLAGSNQAVFSGPITLAKDVTLVGANGGDRTQFSGGIGGTGNVTVTTSGNGRVLFLSTVNTFAGNVTISPNSRLQLSDATATPNSLIPDTANVTIGAGGALRLAKGGNSESINVLLGSGTVEALSGADTLVVGASGGSGTFSGIIRDNGGTLGLTKQGAGTQTITGSLAYSRSTIVSAGTLAIAVSTSVGSGLASAVSDTTGVFSFGGNTITMGNGNANNLYYGGLDGAGTIALRGGNNTITLPTGAAGLAGNGQFMLGAPSPTAFALDTGASTTDRKDFGWMNDVGQPLLLSSLTGFGAIRSDAGGTAGTTVTRFITVNQNIDTTFEGALLAHASTATPSNAVRRLTFEKQGSGSLILAGFIGKQTTAAGGAAAGVNIVVSGGALIITNSNNTQTTTTGALNTSGTVTITSGTLGFAQQALINNAGTIGVASIRMNGGVLRWHGTNTQDITAGGRLTLVDTKNATFDTNGNDVTLGTALGGGAIAAGVEKIGAGGLTLSAANSFTGGVTLTTGRLNVANAAALGSGTLAIGAGTTLDNTSGLSLTLSTNNPLAWNGDFTFLGTNDLDLGTGGLTLAAARQVTVSSNTLTVGGVIDGAGGVTKAGAGTLVLAGANTFAGGVSLTSGTLTFASGGLGSGTATVGGGTLQWAAGNTQDVSGQLALTNSSTTTLAIGSNDVTLASGFGAGSTGGLVKTGAGTLALTGSNDFSGGMQVSSGTLVFGSGGLGPAGNVTIAASTALAWAAGNDQDISSRLVLPNSGDITLDTGANVVSLANGLGSGSALNITKAGGGTLTFGGSNGYTGATTVDGGTLALSGAGNISSSSQLTLASGATFDISAADGDRAIGVLGDSAGSAILLGSNTLSASGGNTTFGGVISGSGGFTKVGSGQLTFTAAQTFTGAVRIAEGTLFLDGGNFLADASRIDIASGAYLDSSTGVTIVDTQTLGGYGTVFGDVTFAAGSLLAPGGSVGTLTEMGGIATFAGGGTYIFDVANPVGTPGTDWDLFVADALDITASGGSPYVIRLTSLASGTSTTPGPMAGWNPNSPYAWLFVDTANEVTSFNPAAFLIDLTDFDPYNVTNGDFAVVRGDTLFGPGNNQDQLYVVYAAVPEPGTLALAGFGLAAAGLVVWRRRRSAHVKE